MSIFISDASNVRMKIHLPNTPKGICIIVSSGHMGSFDEQGVDGEQDLYSALFSLLPQMGYGVVQPDMPLRDNINIPATSEHIVEREKRLNSCIDYVLSLGFEWGNIVLIGFSLGGQIILDTLTNPLSGAILIGCVIDTELRTKINSKVNIKLLYGSNDYIAYLDESGEVKPISPEVYQWNSIKFLKIAGAKNISSKIIKGYGHSLEKTEKSEDNLLEIICMLINHIIILES